MKVSLNWIRDINRRYACSAEPATGGIEELVEKIGAQLGAVDEAIDIGARYEGIVVAKIISVEKHPNADKLTVCMVDDGGAVKGVKRDKNGLVQIVCGAPNVKPTLGVAWIPPGAVVPSTYAKDPFVLETREIRGVVSNGMLASPSELGLGDSHEGLLIIDEPVKPGTPFAGVYGLDDHIIDIENKMFTHRPDLFGMLGLFRELAGIQGHVFKSPAWYGAGAKLPKSNSRDTHPLKVENYEPKLVPRFVMVVLKDITVAPSPVWLQARLSSIGLRPINNIVDLTNYLMHETAQPLHAYDYDKAAGLVEPKTENRKPKAVTIGVRLAEESEKLRLLGGKEITLQGGEIVIAGGPKPIGLAGVMGGADTEVDENTKAIILECGNFNMNKTRRAAFMHGLFTDAATRFTKGQSPLQNVAVAARAVEDIQRLAGGRVVSVHDDNHVPPEAVRRGSLHPAVKVSAGFINSRLGLGLSAAQIEKLLASVEFQVGRSGDMLRITAPFWRTDIAIAEDIVEEVGRLHGYDRLPAILPRRDLTPAAPEPLLDFKARLRRILAGAGANEVLTYSFANESLLRAAGQDPENAYHIRNSLSPDLQYYRLSLIPSLMEKVHPNIKAGFNEFALYEIGKGHVKNELDKEKLPKEFDRVALVLASKDRQGSPFFAVKKVLDYLTSELGITPISYRPLPPHPKLAGPTYYEPGRAAEVWANDILIGRAGEFRPSAMSALKLPAFCGGFELHVGDLLKLSEPARYRPLNRFPQIDQDICLRTARRLTYGELCGFVEKFLHKAAARHGFNFQLKPLDIFEKSGDDKHKQTTWRISLSHPEKTLTNREAGRILDELAEDARQMFNAERI